VKPKPVVVVKPVVVKPVVVKPVVKPAVTPAKPSVTPSTPTKPISPAKPVAPTKPVTPAKPDCTDTKNKADPHCIKLAQLSDTTQPDYDCKKDPTVKVNWDGDCVKTAEPWYDDSLFEISDFSFTIGDAVLTTVIIIVLSSIGFAISSYIAWKKRKAIAAGARRLSTSIRRMSTNLR